MTYFSIMNGKKIRKVAINLLPIGKRRKMLSSYMISASEYRESKNGQQIGNNGKVIGKLACYDDADVIERHLDKICANAPYSIEIRDIGPRNVIYMRHTKYKGNIDLFSKLVNELNIWAEARNLIKMDSNWLVLYHARGEFTKDDKLRVSVCLEVDNDVTAEGAVGKYVISGGKYAVGCFEILHSDAEYQKAWDYMLFKWLPESGYKVDDRISYKEYLHNVSFTSKKKNIVNIYIPISPL